VARVVAAELVKLGPGGRLALSAPVLKIMKALMGAAVEVMVDELG
jgi:hypothetical protein